jgi:excisionase family DNA binding protein
VPELLSIIEKAGLETVSEAQGRLRVSRGTFYKLVNEGEIQTITIGRSRRVLSASVGDFIARRLQAEAAS